jgi:hypothetical protein
LRRSERSSSRCGFCLSYGRFFVCDFRCRRPRFFRRRPLVVRSLHLAHQLVAFFGSHLPALYHILHKIPSALDCKPGDAGCSADDVLHCRGDLCPRFLTDQLRTLG